VNVLNQPILDRFVSKHTEMKNAVTTWLSVAKSKQWDSPHQLKDTFPKASMLVNNQWWFDLNFGGYRILSKVNFKGHIVMVEKVCSHDEYMRLRKKQS